MIHDNSELYRETTLANTNEKSVWAKAFRQNHWALSEYDVKSGNRDLITLVHERRIFIRK